MKKLGLILLLIVLTTLFAACGGAATTEAPTPPEQPTEAPLIETPAGSGSLPEAQPVPIAEIINISWQWVGLTETEPPSQLLVPSPESYTLVLWQDNSMSIQADCNVVSGMYAGDNGQLTLSLGPTTLAECGPDSLYDLFISSLSGVSGYGMRDGQLVLVTNDGTAQMLFQNGGPVEKPADQPEFCAGIPMSSVIIDTTGLPYPWQPNCLPATPYDNTQTSGPVGLPENVQINFGVTNPQDVKPNDPILYIIPVADYEQLWNENADASVTDAIDLLQALLDERLEPLPGSGLPGLPFERVTGVNDLAVQAVYLDIPMGLGLRYVGRFTQSPSPVTNDNPQLFYVYQGFTEDGQYLISFFYPVTTNALPNSVDVAQDELDQVNSDYQAYMAAKAETLNALATSDWEPDLAKLDTLMNSLQFDYERLTQPTEVPPSLDFANFLWQWVGLIETDPAGQSVVPNPQNYTLAFTYTGQVTIVADCNTGTGTYSVEGSNMQINVGAVTRVACEPGSQSEQFLDLLGRVSAYEVTPEQLVLKLADDAGSMQFANAGSLVRLPESPPEGPIAIAIEPINVRSGPGTEYPSYGVVPIGASAEVIGVSQDGKWWVIRLPTDIAPDGRGWVSADYVQVTGAENVPVVEAPPLP